MYERKREREWLKEYMRERRCMRMKDRCTWQREQRERDHHPTHPRPIPKLYYLPVLLIDSLLSTKKWYWSTMIIYVIIRPRCYRETVFNKNFIWTKTKAVSLNQSSGVSPGVCLVQRVSGSDKKKKKYIAQRLKAKTRHFHSCQLFACQYYSSRRDQLRNLGESVVGIPIRLFRDTLYV